MSTKDILLRIGFNTVEGSVRDVAAKEFRRVVSEKTNGQVKMTFSQAKFWSEQEMIESVRLALLIFS